MLKKIRARIVETAFVLTMMLAPVAVVATPGVAAADTPIQQNLKCGVGLQDVGCAPQTTNASSQTVVTVSKQVIDIFSLIVGIISIIMIIYGGLRYITSGGDSGKVGSAKNTIIYAIIGLVIVAIAQTIVAFVLNKATDAVK